MSPVIRECEARRSDYFILHTGQHYSHNMDALFFEELNLPQPKYNLGIGVEPNHRYHVRLMIDRMIDILAAERPDWVLVYGDTNSALAATLAANRLKITIAHIEAGLRSFDIVMAEEVNRMLSDHLASFLFIPTEKSREHVLGEGIPEERIILSGNTVVDAVYQNREIARARPVLEQLGLEPKGYFVVTAHRPENVDFKDRLANILGGLGSVYREFRLPLVFSVHPRTRKMMEQFDLALPDGVREIEPLGYLDFLQLQSQARLILTDSGGIQEEACVLGVPCVTLRDNTERPETLEVGSNILAGVDPSKILRHVQRMYNKGNTWESPYGDGTAAKTILDTIILR